MRISAKNLSWRKITCNKPAGELNLYRKTRVEYARGVKERKPPARGGFTPSTMSAGRRHFEAQGEFRAALAVFRRKMEAGADKTESTFAVGKYGCGGRLKALP